LTRPDKDGKSRLKELLDIKAQTGVVADELKNFPVPPPGTEYLWEWFEALAYRRGTSMAIQGLTWSDIHAFFLLIGVKPARWEIRAITALDDAYLFSRTEEGGKQVLATVGDFAKL